MKEDDDEEEEVTEELKPLTSAVYFRHCIALTQAIENEIKLNELKKKERILKEQMNLFLQHVVMEVEADADENALSYFMAEQFIDVTRTEKDSKRM